MKSRDDFSKVYIITFFCFVIDFLIKNFVKTKLMLLKSIEIIPGFFNITYIQNRGAAWGIFQDSTTLLAIFSLIVFIFISNYVKKLQFIDKWTIISTGFLLGGILGNFIDRVVYGYVIDFLDFKIFNYDYPVFNFADIFIVVGALMFAFKVIRGEKDGSNSKGKRKKN